MAVSAISWPSTFEFQIFYFILINKNNIYLNLVFKFLLFQQLFGKCVIFSTTNLFTIKHT